MSTWKLMAKSKWKVDFNLQGKYNQYSEINVLNQYVLNLPIYE